VSSWDRLEPRELARVQDQAVRAQVRDVVAPFSPFWRNRFAALRIDPAGVDGTAALARLPAVGERDVCPDGDPFGMAALVIQAGEAQFALHASGPTLRRAMRARLTDRDEYRRIVETDTRATAYVFTGLGLRYPVASTRSDLDLVARAGARLCQLLGLDLRDVLVSTQQPASATSFVALQLAATAAGIPAFFPGGDLEDVADTLRLVPATVLAVPASSAAAVIDQLGGMAANLAAVRTVLLVGVPDEEERLAAAAALADAGGPADPVVLSVYAPAGARLLWAECRPAAVAGQRSGWHTYPDLEVVQTVHPETGQPTADGEPLEPVVTQLGFHGTALLRWRTGDLTAGPVTAGPCPHCGRNVPRVPHPLQPGALVTRLGARPLDLRPVAGAISARPDVADWRLVVRRRSRDGRPQLLVDYEPGANGSDPAQVAIALASDIRAAIGLLPTQLILRPDGELARLPPVGSALTGRMLVE
jgi:phenylacetate-coenzyme A ligase PaaK-like adenylate-forming protein